MKLVSFGYDKDFNLLLQFPVFTEPYTQKPLALHQLETVPVAIKIIVQKPVHILGYKYYLAMRGENYISLTFAELDTCKHFGHERFCETIFSTKHKTSQSCESAVFTELFPDIIDNNSEFKFLFNMRSKAVILDARHTLLLSNLDKP